MRVIFFNGIEYVLIYALPLALFVSALKIIFYRFSWEIIDSSLAPFFSSILIGIIFLLTIILGGVLTDYKESEKIPAELANSLCSIWQEACIQKERLVKSNHNDAGTFSLQKKLYDFVTKLKADFLTGKSGAIQDLIDIVDSFSDNFLRMDDAGTPALLMARMRNEQANIRRILFRIQTIRGTSFSQSLVKIVEAIIALFIICVLLLETDPMINGAILVFFYSFLLTSILLFLKDMDNPFEYDQKDKIRSDEIDFRTIFSQLEKSFVADDYSQRKV